jgi:uncharacterized membrane protein
VGEVADLLVAIATLVGSLTSAYVIIRQNRRGSSKQARQAAAEAADKLLDAVADGELDPEEISDIKNSLRRGEDE